jgi:hypothetical protein
VPFRLASSAVAYARAEGHEGGQLDARVSELLLWCPGFLEITANLLTAAADQDRAHVAATGRSPRFSVGPPEALLAKAPEYQKRGELLRLMRDVNPAEIHELRCSPDVLPEYLSLIKSQKEALQTDHKRVYSRDRWGIRCAERERQVNLENEASRMPGLPELATDSELNGTKGVPEVSALLESLSTCEREVIEARFGLNGPELMLREVGQITGLSAERVRQIEQTALEKMHRLAQIRQPVDRRSRAR